MYSNERTDLILKILKEYNYVTVKYLVGALNYSTATVNRDLNNLEKRGLILRSYGGVELAKPKHIPMDMRHYKMKHEKRKIAEMAAKHVKDGDTVFIDSSTTTYYLSAFIQNRKHLTVITNSTALVSDLSVYGVDVICLGGKVTEPPYGLCSPETVRAAASYKADKLFFSAGAFYRNGRIGCSEEYQALLRTMFDNSKKKYFLADSDKFEKPEPRVLCDFSEIQYFFSDYAFDEETKSRFSDTAFVKVDTKNK